MGEDMSAFPKNDTLCKSTGWEIKKLQKVKKRCIEKGFLQAQSRRVNGMQVSNLYTVKTDMLSVFVNLKDKGDTPAPKTDMRLPQNGTPRLPQNGTTEVLTNEVLINNTAASVPDTAYAFEQFWNDYGYKKGSKAKAYAKFRKLTGRDLEALREALPHYLRATVTKDTGDRKGGFKPMRKYPEFFLSGRVWESLSDEINETRAREAATPADPEYQKYLDWVRARYPNLLSTAKHMSRTAYDTYRSGYTGKAKIGANLEREYMIRAHEQMAKDATTLHKYDDVFALHIAKVQEFVQLHTV
jgi:hypothetical protein